MALIQIRSDTAERWALYNPILASGEFGYDKTNEVVKMGDGVTPWSELDITTGLKLSLQDIAIADIQVKNAEGVKINPSTQEGQQAILDRLDDPLPVSINNSIATRLAGNNPETTSTQHAELAGTVATYSLAEGASKLELYLESGYIRIRTDGQPATSTTGEPLGEGFGASWSVDSISIYFVEDSVLTVVSRV